ncbi:SMI1/KNR4 family protein [Paenibacillus melissococcoides]|uniref:SMI1/KNR4 family protein n=1 Tax=Paenibacillus melissococcoides TaxID=2912268 RepID=A0ABN8U992_9BACL|nr:MULTISPECIES: SMI1/KNR4 family protein [Paenibacillus]MEB9893647.1 SMI1/KNR4 family protein [Bacillus cereus]CAH8247704.1 SMI1/KNR4 family protein [Paenibacillus melissococcoides]CAH8705716.1 SMI1/KNR4 family protein [Paenibacillus melissococcoides]CAH8715189.1 SMI1/KNR4 family protein [Paenibacillus melissococcoides]GIO80336.1 hypothetical protein J6TS7_39460 [Paenibacillus dendritiformis]
MKNKNLSKEAIQALKAKLEENGGSIEMQRGSGDVSRVTCTFNPPATVNELNDFVRKTKFILPEDYINFLKICNGCRLFDDIEYGGESELYSLEEILLYTYEDPFYGRFKIAYIYQDNIVIDFRRYMEGDKNYLMVKDHLSGFDECIALGMSFGLWLDKFIKSRGEKFWNCP